MTNMVIPVVALAADLDRKRRKMPQRDESDVPDSWSALVAAGYVKDDFELIEIEDKSQTSGFYALRGKAAV